MGSWTDLLRTPERTGIFLDFDGTLAPIVVDPRAARPVPGAVDALHRLGRRYGRVAVVSGRPIGFLVEHLDLEAGGVDAFGLYGLECFVDGTSSVHADAEAWVPVVETVASEAERVAPDGVGVERKGLTLALHVRPAPQHDAWARGFAEAAAAEHGLKLDRGRLSYELRPPLEIDKGSVVGQLLDGLEVGGFVGDDRGDLLAFDALDRFAADGNTAVKVAVRSDEAPPELLERADELVDGPAAVVARLAGLAVGPGGA
jgi:trehalose 6-phosphate phosphatase